jgi:predicted nucleotidyltransferase
MPAADRPNPESLIARLVDVCAADERVVAAFLGGSRARGQDDAFSDVDVSVVVTDEAYDEVLAAKEGFVRKLGAPLFLEDFGSGHIAFVIFDDGTELELHLIRVSDLGSVRSGPHRVLLDRGGVLEGKAFPLLAPDPGEQHEQLRQILAWFWHDLDHFTTAIGRGHLWWAAGQLEQLRHLCVKLVRIEQAVIVEDEPYWKLDTEISTDPLEPLRSTFTPIEREALVRAGRDMLAFFRREAPAVADAHGLAYPVELDAIVGGRLDRLR